MRYAWGLFFCVLSLQISADVILDLGRCDAIAESTDRLACFNKVVYKYVPAPKAPSETGMATSAVLEKTGFQILAYNEPDHEKAHDYWFALGYNNDKPREQLAKELFAHYTLFRRPSGAQR